VSVNILTLHSGAAADDATFSGAWTYWDDYRRVELDNSIDVPDATCPAGNDTYIVVPYAQFGGHATAYKIVDGSPPTRTTWTKVMAAISGVDVCYDATNGKVYILWGATGSGNTYITRLSLSTWTEDATATLTGYADGQKPGICINGDGSTLYVITYGTTDGAPSRVLKVPTSGWPAVSVAEALPLYGGSRDGGHCIRIDPYATGNAYANTSFGGYRYRIDISGSPMKVVWACNEPYRGASPTDAAGSIDDDIGFDANYAYFAGSFWAGYASAAYPFGGTRVDKATGRILEVYRDTAYLAPTAVPEGGTGIDVNSVTGEIVYSPGHSVAVAVRQADGTTRYRNAPNGMLPDDVYWSADGSRLWTGTSASEARPQHPAVVCAWSQIAGPLGLGRVRTAIAGGSLTFGVLHAATNTGAYCGISYYLDDLGFSGRCDLITLSTDGTTGGAFARLYVEGSRLKLADAALATVSDVGAVTTGWHFAELRYDKAATRYRVYHDGGSCIADRAFGSAQNHRGAVFGPWDASGQSQTIGVHTAFDIQLDDADYDDARWGPITAVLSRLSGQSTAEWAKTGGLGGSHPSALDEMPNLLTPATGSDDDSAYVQSSGASGTDQWDILKASQITQAMGVRRAARVGVRAKAAAGAGTFLLGWAGEDSTGLKTDTWAWGAAIMPGASYALATRTFYKTPAGVYPIRYDLNGWLALKQLAGAGVDARVTQVIVSYIVSQSQAQLAWGNAPMATVGLDIAARGFAAQSVFAGAHRSTVALDIPSRGFAAPDLVQSQGARATAAQITLAGSVVTVAATLPATAGQITLAGAVATGAATGDVTAAATAAQITLAGSVVTVAATGTASAAATVAVISMSGTVAMGAVTGIVSAAATVAAITLAGAVATGAPSGTSTTAAPAAQITVEGTIATGGLVGGQSVAATAAQITMTGTLGTITATGTSATAATAAQITVEGTIATGSLTGGGTQFAAATVAQITLTGTIVTIAATGIINMAATAAQITVTGTIATGAYVAPLPVSTFVAEYAPLVAANAEYAPEVELAGRYG